MSTYIATIRWSREGAADFAKGQYSRAHPRHLGLVSRSIFVKGGPHLHKGC
jgi:hypothetical protein